jgi:hypothetical protein
MQSFFGFIAHYVSDGKEDEQTYILKRRGSEKRNINTDTKGRKIGRHY